MDRTHGHGRRPPWISPGNPGISRISAKATISGFATVFAASVACGDAGEGAASDSDGSATIDGATTPPGSSGSASGGPTAGSSGDPDTDGTATTTGATAPGTGDPGGCTPASCETLGANCGSPDDGCGRLLDCGVCPGDLVCGGDGLPHVCGAPVCVPQSAHTTAGGGRCADLKEAWTARGINVGYYPYRVVAPIEQYSGDFSGDPATVFSPGPNSAGVILQIIPPGSYVGLSSTGPWYDPAEACLEGAPCGQQGVDACTDSSPPLRPGIGGFYWGYAYQGASHMQGWIPYDPARLVFAGFTPDHPCARGPAGVDFEVASACGQPTVCAGGNITCGAANPCTEGADDCGNVNCGAMTGGPLTPSAHKKTVQYPVDVHDCGQQTPHPSIKCFANGNDPDFFLVYPFGAYLYWGQNSTTKHWLHYGDQVQSYYHTRDAQGVLWDFVEVLASGAPSLTPPSDGAGAGGGCSSQNPELCTPCQNGGTCGWIQAIFLD